MAFLSRRPPAAGDNQPEGTAEEILLGQDVLNGQYLQYTVPGGCWFGATPAEGSDFALVGCTVLRDLILRILKWPIPTFWGGHSPTPPG